MKYCKCSNNKRMGGVRISSRGILYVCLRCGKYIDDKYRETIIRLQVFAIIVIWLGIISFLFIVGLN